MIITLSDKESAVFYETIDSELHKCINEYDCDTGRRPSTKRIKDSQYAHNIIDKWVQTQTKITGTNFVSLDNIVACTLDLTDKEITYSKNLLNKAVKELRQELQKYAKPYTGILQTYNIHATAAENILTHI